HNHRAVHGSAPASDGRWPLLPGPPPHAPATTQTANNPAPPRGAPSAPTARPTPDSAAAAIALFPHAECGGSSPAPAPEKPAPAGWRAVVWPAPPPADYSASTTPTLAPDRRDRQSVSPHLVAVPPASAPARGATAGAGYRVASHTPLPASCGERMHKCPVPVALCVK